MSLLNSLTVKNCTDLAKGVIKFSLFITVFFVHVTVHAWEVDLSRRAADLEKAKNPGPTPLSLQSGTKDSKSLLGGIFTSLEPVQEIVILNTDKGFVPDTVRVKSGQNYKIHVVNVNEGVKNVSFILDAFSEHHGTFFGQPTSFQIAPKIEGIFSFQCPETAKQGKIVVVPSETSGRVPASN